MYGIWVFIHVAAAIMGLGAAFAFPVVARSAKTVSQAKYVMGLLKKLEIYPKAGSITLLVTGLILGFLNTDLFTTGWYLTSIVLYLIVQVIVIGLLPKAMKAQEEALAAQSGEELPAAFLEARKKAGKLEGMTTLFAFILIVLMVFKPF